LDEDCIFLLSTSLYSPIDKRRDVIVDTPAIYRI
jgi:hypothetical protein